MMSVATNSSVSKRIIGNMPDPFHGKCWLVNDGILILANLKSPYNCGTIIPRYTLNNQVAKGKRSGVLLGRERPALMGKVLLVSGRVASLSNF